MSSRASALAHGWVCALALVLISCSGDEGATLVVDVRTDLIPGIEFAGVQVELEGEAPISEFAQTAQDWAGQARRVARFEGLEAGGREMTVRLFASGEVVQQRTLIVNLDQSIGLTIFFTRDCQSVICPGDGSPSATACLGGRCVEPDCIDGTQESCVPGCQSDSECPTFPGGCAESTCEDGICLATEFSCEATQYCAPDRGCRVIPTSGPIDASPPPPIDSGSPVDAGSDAGQPDPPDSGVIDSGGMDSGGMDAGAADAGRPDASVMDTGPMMDVGSTDLPSVPLRFPPLGFQTGSVHASTSAVHPLRPKLMWTPVGGAVDYQVQMDDSCSLGSFRSCAFPSPELDIRAAGQSAPGGARRFVPASSLPVSMSQPVGRRYYWRVRGCNTDGCGEWSETRYLDVGRLPGDLNGDGYTDLVGGADFHDSPANDGGGVGVFFGRSDRMLSTPDRTLLNPENQARGHFGWRVETSGDLNGDGYADLVVAARSQDAPANNEGNVFVYLGGPSGPGASPNVTLDSPGNVAEGLFGSALATNGDVNGDGYADLLVGAIEQSASFLYHGGPGGPATSPVATFSHHMGTDSDFGESVDFGDVNGDGYADVISTAPDQFVGMVYVYHGRSGAISMMPSARLENPDSVAVYNWFGISASAGGDLNGDGYFDIVTGAQFAGGNDEGRAYVFYGSSSGVSLSEAATLGPPNGQSTAHFGISMASDADVNGDGFADAVVGSWLYNGSVMREGGAFVYHGRDGNLPMTPARELTCPRETSDAFYGAQVAIAGDIDGDGYADLRVSSPALDEVFIYFGSASGIGNSFDRALQPGLINFGIGLASLSNESSGTEMVLSLTRVGRLST